MAILIPADIWNLTEYDMNARKWMVCAAMLLMAACGPPDDDGAENNEPESADQQTCADAEFESTQPFTEISSLPVVFEHPEDWTFSDETNDFAYAGAISNRTANDAPGIIQLTFTVEKNPFDQAAAIDGYENEGREVLRTIEFGDEMVAIYHLPPGADGVVYLVDAAFAFPYQGDFYRAEYNANGAPDECIPQREALRDAVLDSLAPIRAIGD